MRVHSINDLPADLADTVRLGHNQSGMLCPACEGGRSGERSLSVTRTGFLAMLYCHRAGCGYSAAIPTDASAVFEPPAFKPRPFRGELCTPSSALRLYLEHFYGISEDTVWVYTKGVVGTDDRVYMPVYGPRGEDRGGVLRMLDGSKPKTISFLTTDQPKLAWYHPPERFNGAPAPPIVLVEDQLSAMRCAQLGYGAAALMGTSLNQEKMDEVDRVAGDRPVLLALDKDAFGKATGYAKRWPRLRVVLLDHDIKDSDDADVSARLSLALGG